MAEVVRTNLDNASIAPEQYSYLGAEYATN